MTPGALLVSAASHRGVRPLPCYVSAFETGAGLLASAGINTPLRLSHFLAQVLTETGGGTILRESMSYRTPARIMEIFGVGHHSAAVRVDELSGLLGNEARLAERVYGLGNPTMARGLGNTKPGDGYAYRGGGLMQTTGRAAYRRQGLRAGVDFEASPEMIASAEHALKPAVYEWSDGHLNDAADRNDIVQITRTINGGFNGLDERRAWLAVVWLLAGGEAERPTWRAAVPSLDTTKLQAALNAHGAAPPLVADGLAGPATTAAVRAFQVRAGLDVDGIAGAETMRELAA